MSRTNEIPEQEHKAYYRNEGYNWQTNVDALYKEAWEDIFVKGSQMLGDVKPDDKLLDVGCGKGALLDYLPECNYTGIDISESNIKQAQLAYPAKRFMIADATKLNFPDNTFDKIICVETIEHVTINEINQMASEWKRVSKKGAVIAITTPNVRWLWGLIPWSFWPLKRRLTFRKHFKGLKEGYVNENLLGLPVHHYRFRESFLRDLFDVFFTVEEIGSTFWYNNRAIHNLWPEVQLKIIKYSRKHKFLGLNVGASLTLRLINNKK